MVANYEKRYEKAKERLEKLIPRLKYLNDKNNQLKSSHDFLSSKNNELENKIKELENDNIGKNIIKSDNIILFVEWESDKEHLENAWIYLYPNKLMNFSIQPLYSKNSIRVILNNSDFWLKNKWKLFIWMFDFDSAYEDWEKLWDSKNNECNFWKFCKKSTIYNAYAFLLPIPDIPELYDNIYDWEYDYQGNYIANKNKTFKKSSNLELEHLFYDIDNESLNNLYIEKIVTWWWIIFKINDNLKSELPTKIKDNIKDVKEWKTIYKNFKLIFDLLDEIIDDSWVNN